MTKKTQQFTLIEVEFEDGGKFDKQSGRFVDTEGKSWVTLNRVQVEAGVGRDFLQNRIGKLQARRLSYDPRSVYYPEEVVQRIIDDSKQGIDTL